jgi:hypothetical protein
LEKASPIDIDSPKQVVNLCDDTPVRPNEPRVNLDSFRYEDVISVTSCEGKGSSFSKISNHSVLGKSGKQIDVIKLDDENKIDIETDDEIDKQEFGLNSF